MFRRYFQLSADMVLTQFPQKIILLIRQKIVKTDSRSDKHFFHPGNFPEFLKQFYIVAVIRVQIGAGRREKALSVTAHAVCHLLFAGRMPEIGRRSSHIMNIPFKFLFFRDFFRLFDQRIMAPYLDDPSLMESQGTKTASPETSPAASQAEPDL